MPSAAARRTAEVLADARARGAARPVTDVRLVSLPGNVPPWTATGVRVARGQWVTLLASGRLVLAEALDLWVPPSLALWARVGGRGPLVNGTGDTTSFRSEHDGELELALYNGEWGTRDGALATPVELYATSGGAIDVAVVTWSGTVEDGLAALHVDDPLVAAERARLATSDATPAGWSHLWFLGPTDCFRSCVREERAAIEVDTSNSVGILQKAIDFPLGPATTLAWRWRVDELPAVGAEDTPVAHDYTSLALEFENGRDLTWYWSAGLPVGTHYACPLPTWAARETHWVLRSGGSGLGAWHAERRTVADDYRAAVAGDVPTRVVGAWLIAVSIFGHRRGRATYADVVLRDGDRTLHVI
jgi:hypothetical protein